MSLDTLRDAASRAKKNEIAVVELSRKRKLRELYAVTATLLRVTGLAAPKWSTINLDAASPSFDVQEAFFLDANDLSKGRYFHDSSLPVPKYDATPCTLEVTPHSVFEPSPSSNAPPSVTGRKPAGINAHVEEPRDVSSEVVSGLIDGSPASDNDATNRERKSASPIVEVAIVDQAKQDETPFIEDPPAHSPEIDLKKVAPMTSDDVAAIPCPIIRTSDSDETDKRPQTVHLPRKEEQEKRLREVERSQEAAAVQTRRKEDMVLSIARNGATLGEVPSSPSSTVGANSANTPMPAAHSPDTSPDDESFPPNTAQLQAQLPKNPFTSPEEQADKEEHEGLLKSQMRIAREDARFVEPATPDEQLLAEEREAVRQARDSKQVPELAPDHESAGESRQEESLTHEASNVVQQTLDAVQEDLTASTATSSTENPPTEAAEKASIATLKPLTSEVASPDGDTINVLPRRPPLAPGVMSKAEAAKSQDSLLTKATAKSTRLPQSPPQERMTTRVSSGALRHKSVSEILGETPRPLTPRAESLAEGKSLSSPTLGTPATGPFAAPLPLSGNRLRTLDNQAIEISRLSVANLTEDDNATPLHPFRGEYAALRGASQDGGKDYLHTLFAWQAHQPPRSTALPDILSTAAKTLTTANHFASLRETQDYKILRRIYQLQNANKWSLRQMERSPEPPGSKTHQDFLLAEMKWMRTDFREEKKWKTAVARSMAEACAKWVAADDGERESLQVRTGQKPRDADVSSIVPIEEDATPGLDPSGSNDSESDSLSDEVELVLDPTQLTAPAALFSPNFSGLTVVCPKTPASEKLLAELPLYTPFGALEHPTAQQSQSVPPPIVPVSKFTSGKLMAKGLGPPRKRSRYDYEDDTDEEVSDYSSGAPAIRRRLADPDNAPEQTNVALFIPENQHIRDRLYAQHAFRPPSEFQMPSVAFFENRHPSQWEAEEDTKLRRLVREYSFNWSLIADSLAVDSRFTSGAERRTPWECFERWVCLEGLPTEMSKTQYFRTYNSRLEAAQQRQTTQYNAQQQQQQQQGQTPGQISTPRRRQPVRVEKRRNTRFLALIDSLKKLARRRESQAHKQAEAAKAAALRKQHEAVQPKQNMHTPAEFSRMRHDRDVKIAERQEQYRLNVLAQQRAAALQQRSGQPPNAQQVLPNGVAPNSRGGSTGTAISANANQPNGHLQPGQHNGQSRPHAPQHGVPNHMQGSMLPPQMGMQGVPQAQMQANMQGQQRMPNHSSPQDPRMVMEANRQAQQRGLQMPNAGQQFQVSNGQHLSPGAQHASGNMPNPALLAAMASNSNNGASGSANMSSSMSGHNMSSPRMPPPPSMSQQNGTHVQPQPLSSGHIPTINQLHHQIAASNPHMSPDQVKRATTEQMRTQLSQQTQQRQQALNAATGMMNGSTHQNQNPYQSNGINGMPPNGVNGTNGRPGSATSGSGSPHQAYRAALHSRLLAQSQAGGGVGAGTGSPTVVNNISPALAHVALARPASGSGTPRSNTAGSNGNGMISPGQRLGQGSPRIG
ncbi:hypothetical protein B0A49_01780 [Cryomyces minteri]|uniref:Vacuolar import and degradation protein 21 n=1 Tax=Cryomyces minteri TaxID=331657 RepID=A0A4U0XMQ3_9PEZI|nr:hypothetical protein B0A49_01780 [Cryomyces minteri]